MAEAFRHRLVAHDRGVLFKEVGCLALEQALDAAPASHDLPLSVVDEGVVDEALEVLEE